MSLRDGTTLGVTGGTWLRRAVLVAVVVFAFGFAATGPARAQDSKGTDFWLAFPGNHQGFTELSLFITGDTATSGTVSIPGLSFSAPFGVTPGAITTVALPQSAELQNSDTIESLGIHVAADAEVTVYGLTRQQATTDAYLGLPTDALGTDYINLGYKNVDIVNATQFGIVATQDGTAVTITPTETTNGHAAGAPYAINLNQGQTYLLRNTDPAPADLSGTLIQSSKPIAVFGGHQCANIPPGSIACDTIVEDLPPTTAWGKNFVSMPLATRVGGDTFRILASQDATTVNLNGANVATLSRGQLYEQIISGPAQITADKPVLVMQYSNSSSFDGVTSDPFQMMIPPYEQFLAGYTVSTPASGFPTNYINVEAPNSAVGAIVLDGMAIPAGSFTPIGSSGFSGAQLPVGLGSHTLSGPLPFGIQSYGFANFDSYGYPGGLSLSEVARVASVALAPKTATNQINTQHCVTAMVKDQNGNPVPDIRVDFGVTGANPTTGFAFTNASGEAQFCYMGTNAGDDTITGTVGTLSDTAAKTWVTGPTLAELALTKADAPDPVAVGGNLTYTLTVTNNGPDPSTGSMVTDTLPAGVAFVSATPSQGSCSEAAGTVTCMLGPLAVGASATIEIVVTVTATAVSPLSDTATVAGVEADPVASNNSATAETTISLPAELDHFKCYKAKQVGDQFAPRKVVLTDQFNTERANVLRPEAFCNPVDKDGSGISDPTAHLACYKIRDVRGDEFPKFERRRVEVTDQFGTHTLLLKEPRRLCLPASKSPAGEVPGLPPTGLDHFKCYTTKQVGTRFDPRQVTLTDQFNTERVTVLRPEAFCNPVDKDGSGINDPTAHLACYQIRGVGGDDDDEDDDELPKLERRRVEVGDQFGTHSLLLTKRRTLCLPSSKTVL